MQEYQAKSEQNVEKVGKNEGATAEDDNLFCFVTLKSTGIAKI